METQMIVNSLVITLTPTFIHTLLSIAVITAPGHCTLLIRVITK